MDSLKGEQSVGELVVGVPGQLGGAGLVVAVLLVGVVGAGHRFVPVDVLVELDADGVTSVVVIPAELVLGVGMNTMRRALVWYLGVWISLGLP